ncbi:MAG: homocitrate synthase [Limnochordia bacterium]|nr:homocitrate synthase [Bacillota bacterium]HOB08784.1 homocitrate synthase [Limnochordia bacterium]NLH30945.1 homocitrate synthase [Bacillota bacterium]HPT92344.1 homocitrate synthase [Limnochordia bacterium]HPZ30374.1 homocitrate synthase [Limnochordia bacterium]
MAGNGKNKVYIIDVTNRDGVQTAFIGLSKLQKTMLNVYLSKMGIYQSEIGFPALQHEWNYINANLRLAEKGAMGNMRLQGWVRAMAEDVQRAVKYTNIKILNLSISTSEIMTEGKFGGRLTREDVLKMMTEAVACAKELGIESIGVNAEDASRTEPYTQDKRYDEDYLIRFALAAKEHGADRFRYCDTLGYDRTVSIYDSVKRIAEAVQMPIELHCHNDLGYAVANSVEGAMGALDAGVDAYINTTVNGMGERAGNADLVSVLLALRKSRGLQDRSVLDEQIDLTKAWKLCNYVANAFGVPIPINQVGVGRNAFAHESGIHADGMLKNRKNYELYSPDELGIEDHEIRPLGRIITTGEYGGIKGLKHVYKELGIELENERDILRLVQYASLHNQKPLTADELVFIAKYPEEVEQILTVDPRRVD